MNFFRFLKNFRIFFFEKNNQKSRNWDTFLQKDHALHSTTVMQKKTIEN